jgi:hypothetical protein
MAQEGGVNGATGSGENVIVTALQRRVEQLLQEKAEYALLSSALCPKEFPAICKRA